MSRFAGVFGFVFIGAMICTPILMHTMTQDTVTVAVTGKERVSNGKDSKYLIFTENETFENVDSILSWKFNSSDVYGKIKEGQTCTFDVKGLRIPLFSMYRNIETTSCK